MTTQGVPRLAPLAIPVKIRATRQAQSKPVHVNFAAAGVNCIFGGLKMADPQLENGFTQIANELLDALARTRIPGQQRQVFDFIMRRTYGFKKKAVELTFADIARGTGMSRFHAKRAVEELAGKHILRSNIGTETGKTFSINKDFSEWAHVPKKERRSNIGTELFQKRNAGIKEVFVDKENLKKTSCAKFEQKHLELARHLARLIKKHCPKNITIKPSCGAQWADTFRLMEIRDGQDGKGIPLDEIKEVIDWAFADDFWYAQIQSAGSVRKHWNQLITKMDTSKNRTGSSLNSDGTPKVPEAWQ